MLGNARGITTYRIALHPGQLVRDRTKTAVVSAMRHRRDGDASDRRENGPTTRGGRPGPAGADTAGVLADGWFKVR